MTTVTAMGTAGYNADDTRNDVHHGRSEAVTDERRAGYPPRPRAVTCIECGCEVPPETPVIIYHEYHRPARYFCWDCGVNHKYRWIYVPWLTWGARKAGRYRSEYFDQCPWCGRVFYGALARVYCSEECGEATRASRRDRRRDILPRPCETCHELFTPPRADGRYCSPACRQKAYRRRRAAP